MPAPSDLAKPNTAVLILSCLAREPMHGYRIVKEIDALSEGYFRMREGTLYPHLHQLESDGFVESYWEAAGGTRERRMYRITQRGSAQLASSTAEWRKYQSNVNRILGLAPEPTT